MRYSLQSAQTPLRLTMRTITRSMKFGKNAEIYLKVDLQQTHEYGAVVVC